MFSLKYISTFEGLGSFMACSILPSVNTSSLGMYYIFGNCTYILPLLNQSRSCLVILSTFSLIRPTFHIRDRFMSVHYPRGPKDRKEDLDVDWYQGECPLWLNRFGKPVGRVNMTLFREISGVEDAVTIDFRRIYTSELASSKSSVSVA